jgi:hypothetical protein
MSRRQIALALEPGECLCCQEPTELREIPVEAK